MTSPIQYLKNQTQIDLSNPDINNYINAIADIESPKPSSIPIKIDLRAVYDSVIGIDRNRNCGFDKSGVAPERLRKTDLDKLSEIAANIREKQILYDKINRATEFVKVIFPQIKAAVENQNSNYSNEEFFAQLKIECEKSDIDSRSIDVLSRLQENLHQENSTIIIDEATWKAIDELVALFPEVPGESSLFLDAVNQYKELLHGSRNIIKKDEKNLGNSHTLIRGENGQIFEMLNTMTEAEIGRFQRKTNLRIKAIDQPVRTYEKNGEKLFKIELGAGGFGKARIARNICTDEYMAVKKTHPVFSASPELGFLAQDPVRSNFSTLPRSKQNGLRNLNNVVITPVDAQTIPSRQSTRLNTLANTTNAQSGQPGSVSLIQAFSQPEILKALDEYEQSDKLQFGTNFATGRYKNTVSNAITTYNFSELGLVTIDNFTQTFNVLRYCFEAFKNAQDLPHQAQILLGRYAKEYYQETYNNNSSMHSNISTGIRRFENSDFKLKDAKYNQRFLNTLAKEMLQSLATLHNYDGFSHRDIKPDNIILSQDNNGIISVKLIDIDLIESSSCTRSMPKIGCFPYMPPEAIINEKDGSISYDGQRADAYAMGLTLRFIFGFGMHDIGEIGEYQKLQVIMERYKEAAKSNSNPELAEEIKELEYRCKNLHITPDNLVQNQTRVQALLKAVPEAACVKELSDLMVKIHPGKRFLPSEILNLDFFKRSSNFLSDTEFSAHAHRIVRFAKVLQEEEIHAVNGHDSDSAHELQLMRYVAAKSIVEGRGGKSCSEDQSTLSSAERRKVDAEERNLQSAALLRRTGRKFAFGNGAKANIAEMKLQYAKRH